MSLEVIVDGSGDFAGEKSNIATYAYAEASTPAKPGDDSGGVGEFQFNATEALRKSELLYRNLITLKDSFYGEVTGFINAVSSDGFSLNVSGLSRLGSLNTDAKISAGSATLGELMLEIFALGNINDDIEIDEAISSRQIVYPSLDGNLWVYLKNICTAQQIEISLVLNKVLVRDLREREILRESVESEFWAVEDVELARNIEVNYYNYEYFEDFLAYPKGGWTPDVSVYQVEANETVEFEIEAGSYLLSLEQPVLKDFVNPDDEDSSYSISGNDGLAVPSQLWLDRGGDLRVEIGDRDDIIKVIVTGANIPNLTPFTIGLSSGSIQYSTLRIRGSGVSFEQETVTVPTGLTENETSNDVGLTISNPFISTREEAYTAGVRARGIYASPRRSVSLIGRQLFDPNQSEIPIFNTFADFDELLIPLGPFLTMDDPILGRLDLNVLSGDEYIFSDFDQQFDGFTFDDIDDLNTLLVSQSFGSLSGSRVRYREAYFRVRQANTTETSVSIETEFDTIISDFNTENSGKTFDDFQLAFYDLKFQDFSIIPLRTDTDYPFLRLDNDDVGILDLNVLA